ncbi:signal recognition particle-docking protein FtsY [Candidatus Pacearchaeota archaeon]|nr:signal recognition particle-docking protein FtsY [Candidatus Pacearchaeota archaeon]
MFNFLKDKLKSWIKPKVVVLKPKKEEKKIKEKKPKEKIEHKIRTKKELEEERKISSDLIEDIKKEKGEEIRPIPRPDEIIEQIKQEKEKKETEEKKSFWERIGLSRKYRITEQDFSELFESLENILLENNVALDVVDYLRENLKKELVDKEVKKEEVEEAIKTALKNSLSSLFIQGFNLIEKIKSKEGVFVIVFFGINGSGKTTTIAKLASFLKQNKISSVFAAADTFRAASIEQLVKHGEKLRIKVIKQTYGSDPAAVAYDAIEYAKARKIKVVLVDTAGRMYTNSSLLKEMEKIIRVSKPDLKLFVGEAITGNDATEQAKTFNQAVGIDGIILSKQDVDEKGGTSLSVSYVTGKPILFLGTGQDYKDLEEFNKEEIIKALGLD